MSELHTNYFMGRKEFKKFYNENIEGLAKYLSNKHKKDGFYYVNNMDGVYEAYLNEWYSMRLLIKNSSGLKDDETRDEDIETLLDGHKAAACITVALTQVRIITNNKIDDTRESSYNLHESHRLNEQVAVLCGINYLLRYMINKPSQEKTQIFSYDDFKIEWPKTDYDTEEKPNHYLDSLIRGVFYSSLGSKVDPMLLANIYFLIEQYHRKSVEIK